MCGGRCPAPGYGYLPALGLREDAILRQRFDQDEKEGVVADRVDVAGVLAAHFADPATSWSVGTFGVIAEFMRDPDELVVLESTDVALSAVTDRGGIRIRPVEGLRLVASESTTSESWNQRVALCLPDDRCAMHRRSALTELGPDAEAIRETDRAAILFDLGLDTIQVDACVRVSDPDVARELRACCGKGLLEPDNLGMGVILAASPPRVFISRVGRVEVFQPIPPANGKSPEGPHTHVLPRLLRSRRTHAATEAVPEGWVPCTHFYPAHPTKDALGARRPYEQRHYDAFQDLMRVFGDGKLVDLKNRMTAAVRAGADPSAFAVPLDRFARTTIRIGLRQLQAASGASPVLAAWQAAHDRPHQDDAAEAGHGHEP
jgi:hypothetical protein